MPTAAASSAPAAATGTGASLGAMPASIPALPLLSAAAAPLSLSWSQPPTPSPSHSASGSEAAGSSLLTGTPAAASSSDMLAWLVATLAGQPQTPSGTMGERVFIGNGLPALPKKLLTKIRNWEYIELADLLPAPHSAGDPYGNGPPAARFPLFPGCEVVRHKRRQITSISQWTQAFTIYTAALVSVHLSATLELLAYMLTIIRASQQYDGLCWRSYDTNYRIAAAASGNRSWSKLDTDLFTRFFTGRARTVNPCTVCDALTHTSTDCPEAPAQPKRDETRPVTGPHPKRRRPFAKTWAADVCAEFNSKGVCSFGARCRYRHVCGECSGSHAARSCPSKA